MADCAGAEQFTSGDCEALEGCVSIPGVEMAMAAGALHFCETSIPVVVEERSSGVIEEIPVGFVEQASSCYTRAFSCSICMEGIALEDTALVKGCEHAYCDVCILRWAACKDKPTCPQCKTPFDVLLLHKGLDGVVHDAMQPESVCLLLRTVWYLASGPASVQPTLYVPDEPNLSDLGLAPGRFQHESHYLGPAGRASGGSSYRTGHYDDYDEEDDYYEEYEERLSHRVLGNRRWGEHGYVRAGRMAARPRPSSGAGSSSGVGGDGPGSALKKKGKPPLTPAQGNASAGGGRYKGNAGAGAGGSSHGGSSGVTAAAILLSPSQSRGGGNGSGSGDLVADGGCLSSGVAAASVIGGVSPAGPGASAAVISPVASGLGAMSPAGNGSVACANGAGETTPVAAGGRRARRKQRREQMDLAEAQAHAQAVVG